uniref:Uncharacterized protein n=1 Tax=Mycena chlorophos TaxID=658473 RepID=A0ABQ0LDM8_MYCCL|nr:predicted protein [Mycena chlorophos]
MIERALRQRDARVEVVDETVWSHRITCAYLSCSRLPLQDPFGPLPVDDDRPNHLQSLRQWNLHAAPRAGPHLAFGSVFRRAAGRVGGRLRQTLPTHAKLVGGLGLDDSMKTASFLEGRVTQLVKLLALSSNALFHGPASKPLGPQNLRYAGERGWRAHYGHSPAHGLPLVLDNLFGVGVGQQERALPCSRCMPVDAAVWYACRAALVVTRMGSVSGASTPAVQLGVLSRQTMSAAIG